MPDDQARPFEQLSDSGLLWLINRTVFYPRGYALGVSYTDGRAVGWSLIGDGSEPWEYGFDESDHFRRVEATLKGSTPMPTDQDQPAGEDAPKRTGPVERVFAEGEAPVERGTRAPGERRNTPRPPRSDT